MTRQVDELARHVRRLGNHELNELLLQLPEATFAALVEVALARPVLPAGLVLRFEPVVGADGWTVVACAPRRRLGILTRDRDPNGRLVYRAWTGAGDPLQLSGISSWRRRGDAAAVLPGSPRSAGPVVWLWPPMFMPCPTPRCTSCCGGCLGSGSTGWWRLPSRPRGRPHDPCEALSALRAGQGGRPVLPAPRSAAVSLLPALHSSRLPSGPA